jgi:hypothetical protein
MDTRLQKTVCIFLQVQSIQFHYQTFKRNKVYFKLKKEYVHEKGK